MTTTQELATKAIREWIDTNLPHDEDNFGADEALAEMLVEQGLIQEYKELAPENRLGLGVTKDHVIISDNLTRTTIEITHDLASDLITALLMAKSHQGESK